MMLMMIVSHSLSVKKVSFGRSNLSLSVCVTADTRQSQAKPAKAAQGMSGNEVFCRRKEGRKMSIKRREQGSILVNLVLVCLEEPVSSDLTHTLHLLAQRGFVFANAAVPAFDCLVLTYHDVFCDFVE